MLTGPPPKFNGTRDIVRPREEHGFPTPFGTAACRVKAVQFRCHGGSQRLATARWARAIRQRD
jgi:hypothetical protein